MKKHNAIIKMFNESNYNLVSTNEECLVFVNKDGFKQIDVPFFQDGNKILYELQFTLTLEGYNNNKRNNFTSKDNKSLKAEILSNGGYIDGSLHIEIKVESEEKTKESIIIDGILFNYTSIKKGFNAVIDENNYINETQGTNYNWNHNLNFRYNSNIDYDKILETKEVFKNSLNESLKYGFDNFNTMIAELEYFFNY